MVDDTGTIQLLRAFMAALLRGPAKYQRFLHLIGPGGTGKSTFIRLLQLLVGEQNTVATDLRQLEQNRFESAMLYQKRLAMITESDKYGGSVNNLKAATGQDPLRLERKHTQQAGSFIFDGLVLMASNEALTTTDHSSGIERRRVTVPFEKRITEEQKLCWNECGGEEQLRAEIPGLVNWLLDMSIEEMERAISQPPARVVNANIEAMRSSNPVADWVMENCIPALGVWTQVGVKNEVKDSGVVYYFGEKDQLYPNYLQWCRQNGREPLSVRRFRPKVIGTLKNCLMVDVMKTRRGGGFGFQGIRLRGENEPVHEWLKNSQV
jgi:putative DNA primase/helicase